MKRSIFRKILSLTLALWMVMLPSMATAADISYISDELSRIKTGELSNHEIRFLTDTGVESSSDTITITFDTGFSLGTLSTTSIDIAEGNSNSCASTTTFTERTIADDGNAAAGEWGFATSSQTITLTAPTNAPTGGITDDRCVRIKIGTNTTEGGTGTAQVTNSGVGDKTVVVAGDFGDVGTTTVKIIGDDQVAISAKVLQSITFSLSSNSIAFGDLNASAARYAASTTQGSASETVAHNFKAGTNANSGYTVTVEGATLTDVSSNTITAISPTAASSSAGTEQFGMRIIASGGDGVVSAPYSAGYAYVADSGTTDIVASYGGSAAETIFNTYYLANIASNTEAGSYSATLTYVATANF